MTEREAGESGASGESTAATRLLVVEDEDLNRQLFRAVLLRSSDPRLRGSTIREAATLARAREDLAAEPADLVALDIRLPDGNGLELARELLARSADDRPRILVMSASVLPSEREAALDAGCDGFLAKPYLPAELLAALADLLGSDELD